MAYLGQKRVRRRELERTNSVRRKGGGGSSNRKTTLRNESASYRPCCATRLGGRSMTTTVPAGSHQQAGCIATVQVTQRGEPGVERAEGAGGVLTHLDLFSGIGGFALAAQRAGLSTIGFSENNEYCSKLLKQHWPNVPNHGDIRNVRGVRADVVTGGFPCQPFSRGGKQLGSADDRYLWPEMLRVIEESDATWVVGENVPGIDDDVALETCLSDLERIGYEVRPFAVPAAGVGCWHLRERVWILAHSTAQHGRSRGGVVPGGVGRPPMQSGGLRCDVVAPEWQPSHEWFEREPGLVRLVHGIPNRTHRLEGLGNSIVPEVAFAFLSGLVRLGGGGGVLVGEKPSPTKKQYNDA